MDSVIFSFNAIIPIVALMVIGYLLKRVGWVDDSFAKKSNKIVFHLFLPCMLFLNVCKIEDLGKIEYTFVLYPICVILAIFFLSIPLVKIVTKEKKRRGPLLQVVFRSNYALIGLPIATALFGEQGALIASLLSAIIIPLFNVMAVISLSIFYSDGKQVSIKGVLLNIIKNPLIDSIVLALAFMGVCALLRQNGIEFGITDIAPLYKTLNYLSNVATPLALISLGAQFEFSVISEMKREIVFGSLARTVFVPLIGLCGALIFRNHFNGAHFAAFVALFCTPVAVSSVPMTQEMGSDHLLAGQLVVWTTIFSLVSIFIASLILRMMGIF